MTIAEEFEEAVNAHLAGLNAKVDAVLARIAGSQPAHVQWLLFEYDSPHFAESFAVRLIPMPSKGGARETQLLLDDGSVVVPADIYDAPRFEEVEPWDTASELFERWLASRWALIPGSPPPAFVGHHDSFFKTNLADGTNVSVDEIAARFRVA